MASLRNPGIRTPIPPTTAPIPRRKQKTTATTGTSSRTTRGPPAPAPNRVGTVGRPRWRSGSRSSPAALPGLSRRAESLGALTSWNFGTNAPAPAATPPIPGKTNEADRREQGETPTPPGLEPRRLRQVPRRRSGSRSSPAALPDLSRRAESLGALTSWNFGINAPAPAATPPIPGKTNEADRREQGLGQDDAPTTPGLEPRRLRRAASVSERFPIEFGRAARSLPAGGVLRGS